MWEECAFTFTGKERDVETGYGYFGERYYDADLMTGWMSVGPDGRQVSEHRPVCLLRLESGEVDGHGRQNEGNGMKMMWLNF